MKSVLSAAVLVLVVALPVLAQQPAAPGLKYSKSSWGRAWLARERVKKSGALLDAKTHDELLKDGSELLRIKKRIAAGTLLAAKHVRGAEAELADLEKKEAEVLAKIRAYADREGHQRDELKALQDDQELAQRRLREQCLMLDLDLRPRLKSALEDFRDRCDRYARRVKDAFLRKGLIARTAFDRAAKELMRRQDYSPDSLGHTHCNAFVHDFAGLAFGYEGLRGKSANEIVDLLRTGKDGWAVVHGPKTGTTPEEGLAKAQELANAGYLVIAAYRSTESPDDRRGHVALVLPGEMKASALWGIKVPDTAQAGGIVYERGPMSVGFERHKDFEVFVRKP